MKEVYCYKCNKLFEIDTDEFYATPEEDTFNVVVCPNCKSPNSLSWSKSIDFKARQPDEEDIKDYPYIFKKMQERS